MQERARRLPKLRKIDVHAPILPVLVPGNAARPSPPKRLESGMRPAMKTRPSCPSALEEEAQILGIVPSEPPLLAPLPHLPLVAFGESSAPEDDSLEVEVVFEEDLGA
jgi:hypothetical protein